MMAFKGNNKNKLILHVSYWLKCIMLMDAKDPLIQVLDKASFATDVIQCNNIQL